MPNPVAAIAGGSVVSGLLGASASKSAASAASKSSDRAADAQLMAARETNALNERIYNDTATRNERIYNETVARSEPARQLGLNALQQLSGMTAPTRPTGFTEDPGYRFALQEGQDAMNRRASAGGIRLSGAAIKDAGAYATGMASQQYGDWWNRERNLSDTAFNRTASVAGVGQTATSAIDAASSNYASATGAAGSGYASSVGNTNMNAANNVGNALMSGGQARASGYLGQANALQGTIGGLANTAGLAYGGYFGQNPGFGITPFANPYARTT